MATIPANTDENKMLVCKNNWKVIMVIVQILNLWLSFAQVYPESLKYRHFTCWIWLQWFRLAFFKVIDLFYFWLCWAFTGTCGLSRGYSPCRASSLVCVGFSAWGSKAPERRFSSGGPQAWSPHSAWSLPGRGTESMSPALAHRLFTTRQVLDLRFEVQSSS